MCRALLQRNPADTELLEGEKKKPGGERGGRAKETRVNRLIRRWEFHFPAEMPPPQPGKCGESISGVAPVCYASRRLWPDWKLLQ